MTSFKKRNRMTDFQQPNYSRLSPCAIVVDVKKSMDFYINAFGFEVVEKNNPNVVTYLQKN